MIGECGPRFPTKSSTALCSAEGFPRLRSLHIRIGGLKLYEALGSAPLLGQLRYLHLWGTVSQKCADALINLPGFQGLTGLTASVGPANRHRLRDHFGERFLG
jgi:hypothetical protein